MAFTCKTGPVLPCAGFLHIPMLTYGCRFAGPSWMPSARALDAANFWIFLPDLKRGRLALCKPRAGKQPGKQRDEKSPPRRATGQQWVEGQL